MERLLSENDEQSMVSSFLEIAVGQTTEIARQFLQVFINSIPPLLFYLWTKSVIIIVVVVVVFYL